MNVSMGDGSNDVVEPIAVVKKIVRKPTRRSREESGPRLKETSFRTNRERS